MKPELRRQMFLLLLGLLLALASVCVASAPAQPSPMPAAVASHGLPGASLDAGATSESVRIATVLTLLSLGPALIVSMTAFIRIIIVLSMIRHAFGMPETPPTPVLISLGLFLTVFAMLPTMEKIHAEALQPFMNGSISMTAAAEKSSGPLRDFMLRQVRQDELRVMYELSSKPLPASAEEVSLLQLTPAFILNELRIAFQIGFVVLLPFLLIDLVVSSILLALGMLMVPPATISLPLKVLMFILVDGWSLILRALVGSFH